LCFRLLQTLAIATMKSAVPASLVALVASQDVFLAPQVSTGMVSGFGVAVDAKNVSDLTVDIGLEVGAQDDSCVNFLNGLRAQHGLSPVTLMPSKMSCAANQASGDAASSAHHHFGDCGEAAQCEAMHSSTDMTCEQGIQMYYNEGPPKDGKLNHYQIIMSSSYKSMSYGHCTNCGSWGTYYTHDFFWDSGPNPAPTPPAPPPSPSPSSASCAAHSACSGLAGDCCPTTDGVQLDCCSAHLEVAEVYDYSDCNENYRCADIGLPGKCCPTTGGVFLDCCSHEGPR